MSRLFRRSQKKPFERLFWQRMAPPHNWKSATFKLLWGGAMPCQRLVLGFSLMLSLESCTMVSGRPEAEVARPEQMLDFSSLYRQNCAGCHGATGKNGPAPALANPIFLAAIGESNLHQILASGVPGTLMPPFDQSSGGTLTPQQIDALVQGLLHTWGRPVADLPPYAATLKPDPEQGKQSFAQLCAPCHGVDGKGGRVVKGSLVDPAYLALMSDLRFRLTIIAGRPDLGMPNWRSHGAPMTDRQITDIVAWLAAQRK